MTEIPVAGIGSSLAFVMVFYIVPSSEPLEVIPKIALCLRHGVLSVTF